MERRWHSFDPTYWRDLRPEPGCYVLFYGGYPAYVGQSECVRKRIQSHRFENIAGCWHREPGWEDMRGHVNTSWGPLLWDRKFTGKVCYPRRYGEHLMLEARLIRRLQPMYNVRGR